MILFILVLSAVHMAAMEPLKVSTTGLPHDAASQPMVREPFSRTMPKLNGAAAAPPSSPSTPSSRYTHPIFSDDNSSSPSHRFATSGPPLATL
jgi:hypothetical protein